jgi:hypothetical protein
MSEDFLNPARIPGQDDVSHSKTYHWNYRIMGSLSRFRGAGTLVTSRFALAPDA